MGICGLVKCNGIMKESWLCWMVKWEKYLRGEWVLKKKNEKVGIRKSTEGEKKRVEWSERCESRKSSSKIWNKVIRVEKWR